MSIHPVPEINTLQARRGAEILLEVLRSEGVEYVFGNPGTTELPLKDALLDAPDLQYILALQEASAVAMADGYAQAARKPGYISRGCAGGPSMRDAYTPWIRNSLMLIGPPLVLQSRRLWSPGPCSVLAGALPSISLPPSPS